MNTAFTKKVYLFILPAFVLYTIFWIVPLLSTGYFSLTNTSGFMNNYKFVGLQNYKYVLSDNTLLNCLKNTLIYVVIFLLVINILALCIALLLNTELKLKGLYRSVFYLPTLFSTVVVGFIWGYVYMPYYGLISSLLGSIGLESLEPNFLGNMSTALYAIIIVDIWKSLGGYVVIFLAGLQTIPKDLIEAGTIDGCNRFQLIRYIKIPLLAPSLTINVILGLIGGLKTFDYVYIMTQGGPNNSTQTLMSSVFNLAFRDYLFGKGAALGILAFFSILIITAIALKILQSWEVEA